MRIDIMTDLETLGTDANSTIFQIAALAFDIKTGEPVRKFNKIADISRNKQTLNVSGSTLKWWLNTDKELFRRLLNAGDLASEDILLLFWHWLKELSTEGELYLWGNGILFDNKMIQYQLQANNMEYPIKYTNDRDVRTIVELASHKLGINEKELKTKFTDKALTAHDAFDDCIKQISIVSNCYRILTE